MAVQRKVQEVQFYLDRSKESLITTLKSILGNPRLSLEEQVSYMRMMSDHHRDIFEFIEQKLDSGKQQGRAMAEAVIARQDH